MHMKIVLSGHDIARIPPWGRTRGTRHKTFPMLDKIEFSIVTILLNKKFSPRIVVNWQK